VPANQSSQVSSNSIAYSIWSIDIEQEDIFKSFTVGAEVDDVKGTRSGGHFIAEFSLCA